MADNNNNTTTTGVDNTSALSKSNTTPKRITNNNTTTTGVDNTTTVAAPATANNNTNDNVEHNSTPNSPQPFTPGQQNNNNADKTNNTNNFTPADVIAVSSSTPTTTPTSGLKPTILSYTSKSNYKLPSLGDRKVGVSDGLVNKRRAVLAPMSSLEVIKQENKNLLVQIEKLNHINSLSQIDLSTTKNQLKSARDQEYTTSVLLDHARQQLEQSEDVITRLHNTIENNQGSVASLIEQFESLTATNANANALRERDNALRERDSHITELQRQVGIMKELCVNLEKELKVKDAELEGGIEGVIVQVTQRTEAQVKLEKERDARKEEHALMDKERGQVASTIAELEAKIATLSVEKDIEAVAPLHMEEDENGDDKMAVEEEKASAESKGTLAVSDVEMKEVNEPAVPYVEMKEANEPARSNDTAEPIRKMKSSPAEQTPNQEKELGESEGSNLQLEKESDAEISKWEEKINELNHALASSQSPEEKKVLHQKIAVCINVLGEVRLKKGYIKEAAEDFQRVLKFSDATYSTKMNAIRNHAKANILHETRLAPLLLPAEMLDFCNNDTFHEASSKLTSAGPLKAAAEESNRNFCAFDCKIKDSPDSLLEQVAATPPVDDVTPPVIQVPESQQSIVEQAITEEPKKIVFALFHFTSNKNHNLHKNGSLYSGGKNCHPFSPTSGPFIELWANALAHGLNVDGQNALPVSMNQIVWGDIFNLDGDFDDATNAQKRAAFEQLVEETEAHNLKFVLENIKLLGDDTEVFMIIFSNASWKFYKQHESEFPPNVKVIQDRSLVHTCLMSQTIGITERQAFTLVDVMIKTQSKMIGVDTPEVEEELVRKVIGPGRINSRECDKYVYVGRYNEKIILVGGGCVAFLQLLIDEGATTHNFPNQPTIQHNMENGTATEHAGLEVEIHQFNSDEVVSLQTGPQDDVHKSDYDQWYKCSEKRQAYNGERISASGFGYEVWEGPPDEGTLLIRGVLVEIKNEFPIDSNKFIVEGLKVGDYKKVDLGSGILKGDNKQEYSDLHIRKIEFSKDADNFKKPGVFPLTNSSIVGKENKGHGGHASKAVVLHLQVSDGKGSYIIEESNRVVQVGSPKHACQLIGRTKDLLNGLVKGEKRPITAKNKEQGRQDTPAGAKLIAVLATVFDKGPSTSSSPRFGGRTEGKGLKFDSISSSFADRLVPDHLWEASLGNPALEAINEHYAEYKEWKKYSELLADGDVKDKGKKKKTKKKKGH